LIVKVERLRCQVVEESLVAVFLLARTLLGCLNSLIVTKAHP